MSEAATVATKQENTEAPGGLLDGIKVKIPQESRVKSKQYLCSIKAGRDTPIGEALDRFDFHIGVGPATFCRQTFRWEGKGREAVQVFMPGAVTLLSEAQVQRVRSMLQTRYIRPTRSPATGELLGLPDIDSSDGGDNSKQARHANGGKAVPPEEIPDRTAAGDIPLHTILRFELAHSTPKGYVVTIEEARKILQQAEEEEKRILENPQAVFETGVGGKLVVGETDPHSVVKARDAKKAFDRNTIRSGRDKAEGGYIPDA